MNVWIRRLGAAAMASPAFLTSEGFARASEQTVELRITLETCLNHINTQEFKLLGDTEFVLRAHACARTLFSVTKGCIENKKLVSCSCHCCIWPQKLLRSEHH